MSCVRSWGSIFLSFGSASKKRSRPAGYNRTRTRALNLRGTTLLRCALADAAFSRQKPALRGNGRTPSQAHCSPARLQDHLRHRAACPVPSFGLSVRRRRCVLFSSQPIYIVMSIIRKNGGFVNIKSRNPDRTVPWCRAAPCRRPQPHGRDGRSSP